MESHIRISDGDDEPIWAFSPNGKYSPKFGYLHIFSDHKPHVSDWWWSAIWKLKAPARAKIFMWCILHNKVPTGDNLQKGTFHGPSWCVLCKQELQGVDHLFLTFPFTISIWTEVITLLHI